MTPSKKIAVGRDLGSDQDRKVHSRVTYYSAGSTTEFSVRQGSQLCTVEGGEMVVGFLFAHQFLIRVGKSVMSYPREFGRKYFA